jgi:protein subunit release factor B
VNILESVQAYIAARDTVDSLRTRLDSALRIQSGYSATAIASTSRVNREANRSTWQNAEREIEQLAPRVRQAEREQAHAEHFLIEHANHILDAEQQRAARAREQVTRRASSEELFPLIDAF